MPIALTPCVLIPCFNHGATMAQVLARLAPLGLPCIVIDDGSDSATRSQLESLATGYPDLTLVRLQQNAGKGAAVIRGLEEAKRAGFSHAVQVDADGQHAIEDIPALLALAAQHPQALISGQPVYDDSVPRARLYGRYVTHVWVWIETLSLQLRDSMCGFRVYPVEPTLRLAEQVPLGQRMDFDTEVMVRLYWQGHDSYFLPTRVTYPQGGISHFDALRDNLRISWMHTRLFFGMLPRIPQLLFRRREKHWARQPEVKGLWGMRLMISVWRLMGRRAFSLLLWPVIGAYWLTAGRARQASQQWIARVKRRLADSGLPVPDHLNSFRHFMRFGTAMLDKVAGWRGEMLPGRDVVFAPGAEAAMNAHAGQGQLLLASHLGDVEACRALSSKPINALVFSANAQGFKRVMEESAPDSGINLIQVDDIGPETAMLLKEKLDCGEWVAIVGDRVAVSPQRGGGWRVCWSSFMGSPAPFPQGPFILAAVLRCPVLLIFALKQQNQLRVYCEQFANPLLLPRGARDAGIQEAVDRYARRLEHYALMSPLDWFNFFDFWQLPDTKDEE
ncbi:glycosyltransferase family 2 protein [Pluralibacter gergoviae]